MVKPKYIDFIEKDSGIFSTMIFHKFSKDIVKYLDEKSFTRVYEVGTVQKTGKASWDEIIYKTKQDFFIHVGEYDKEYDSYCLNIYYRTEQKNELLFFTNQILKPFNNGTIDNTAVTTENK
jgi:hypothetical protein